jgi:hypothetical protein
MVVFFVKRMAGDGNSLFQSLAILLKNVSYYSVVRFFIADTETVLRCAEYNN